MEESIDKQTKGRKNKQEVMEKKENVKMRKDWNPTDICNKMALANL